MFALRLVIALAVLAPTVVYPQAWPIRFAIALGAFGAGRLVVAGLDKRPWLFVAGCVVALGALAGGLAPAMRRRAETTHEAFDRAQRHADEPHPVAPPARREGTWSHLWISADRTCATRPDGTLWCWGSGGGYPKASKEPAQVSGFANPTAVSLTGSSICALIAKRVWCAGWTSLAPTQEPVEAPVRVPIDEDLVAVAGGMSFDCALAASGALWCWGMTERGELGHPPTHHYEGYDRAPRDVFPPARVALPPVQAIAAHGSTVCALAGGDVSCWGDLGAHIWSDGPVTVGAPPTVIASNARAVAVGDGEICLDQAGAIACRGQLVAVLDVLGDRELGMEGEFGVPHYNWDQKAISLAFKKLGKVDALHPHPELAHATQLALGVRHGCALVDHRVRCWGANYAGQLGDGTRTDRVAAVEVDGLPDVVEVAAGERESCALTADGALWCW